MAVETARAVGFPNEVWLGKQAGQWPVAAFVDEGAAKIWASEAPNLAVRYVIGPIPIGAGEPARTAVTVPRRAEWSDSPAALALNESVAPEDPFDA